jgi:hypothetical protein
VASGLSLQRVAVREVSLNALCAELGVAAALTGAPFRMGLSFDEPDPDRLSLKRTPYTRIAGRGVTVTMATDIGAAPFVRPMRHGSRRRVR